MSDRRSSGGDGGSGSVVDRTLRSPRVRALLSLGILAAVAVPGTLAHWVDQAAVEGDTFTSGVLELRLDDAAGPEPATYTMAGLPDMLPGESLAASFPVRNVGSVEFGYTAVGTATGALAPYLSFRAVVGGAAANTSTGLRTGTCTGGTAQAAATLGGTPAPVIGDAQVLAAGSSQTVCILVSLSAETPNDRQGASGTGTIVLTAEQLGAP